MKTNETSNKVTAPRSEHAPGPWKITRRDRLDSTIEITITMPGALYDSCYYRSTVSNLRIAEANARLIAAAPILLAALKDALDYFEQREDADYDDETQRAQGNAESHEANAIRAVIAKAEGVSK